jgi:fructokinase
MRHRIGIDLGGTKTEGILLDGEGRIARRERHPTPGDEGYEAIIGLLESMVRSLERDTGGACPVGIGTPGAISTRTGGIKNSNTTCLNGRDLAADLERQLGRLVRVANDANCFALSEATDGAAAGKGVVFGVILGTGVGGGVVVGGRLHQGLQRIAGEWGHNVLERGGPRCYCGRLGCVETFLSGPGLVRDYVQDGGEPGLDPAAIVRRVDAGEACAAAAWDRYVLRFGRALAMVVNVLDPHAVVLGGGMSNIDRLDTDGRESLALEVFNDELLTPVVRNRHGDSSGVRGAALLWDRDDAAWTS